MRFWIVLIAALLLSCTPPQQATTEAELSLKEGVIFALGDEIIWDDGVLIVTPSDTPSEVIAFDVSVENLSSTPLTFESSSMMVSDGNEDYEVSGLGVTVSPRQVGQTSFTAGVADSGGLLLSITGLYPMSIEVSLSE